MLPTVCIENNSSYIAIIVGMNLKTIGVHNNIDSILQLELWRLRGLRPSLKLLYYNTLGEFHDVYFYVSDTTAVSEVISQS